jgi:hypothetical protein
MPYCRNCGTQMIEGGRFCGSCGAASGANSVASSRGPEPKYVGLILGAIVGTMIMFGEGNVLLLPLALVLGMTGFGLGALIQR